MPLTNTTTHPYQLTRMRAKSETSTTYDARGDEGENVIVKLPRTKSYKQAIKHEIEVLDTIQQVPHVTKILNASHDGSWLAIVPIDGIAIHTWANDKPIAVILEAFVKLVSIVESLHSLDLVHADIKPNNVLVSQDNTPSLIDFGSATTPSLQPPNIEYTPGFAAPELLRGENCSPATDRYALGALLYTLLTGTNPFRSADETALRHLPLISIPLPPSTLNPLVPQTIDKITSKLLFREPSARMVPFVELKEISMGACTERPAPPHIGMTKARESLMRAIVSGLDGACVVVSIYGKKGSGRSTIADFAMNTALTHGYNEHDNTQSLAHITKPTVIQWRNPTPAQINQLVQSLKDNRPLVAFVLTEKPCTELIHAGALVGSPQTLTTDEIEKIAQFLASNGRIDQSVLADKTLASTIRSRTRGLPAGVHAAFLRIEHQDDHLALITALPDDVSEVYDLISSGLSDMPGLLSELSTNELDLIHIVDLLVTCKLVTVSPTTLRIQVADKPH